ncbi:hypothetical protein P154DRAFT_625395, partial [Amniculicola lignicola CBS 123094]
MFGPLLLLLGTIFIFHALAQSSCYYPNGTAEIDPLYQPCSSNQSDPLHTICCALNVAADVEDVYKDICLPNGVCQEVIKGESTHYYRELCTESDWENGSCLNICTEGEDFGLSPQITPCNGSSSSERWCCGDSTDCCTPEDNPAAIILSQIFGVVTLPESTSQSENSHAKLTKITLGVGLGIGIPILVVLGALLWFTLARRRNSTAPQSQKLLQENKAEPMELMSPASELDDSSRHELHNNPIPPNYGPYDFETKPQFPETWLDSSPVEVARPHTYPPQELQ